MTIDLRSNSIFANNVIIKITCFARPNYAYTVKQGWRKELKKRDIYKFLYFFFPAFLPNFISKLYNIDM